MKKKKSSPKSKIDISSKLKISACYMVKNESKNLPRSIDSLKTQVDEIIVVDTGSTDNTIEIAKSYGAKVIETEWQEDFSTPRNIAIDNASGDWIIFLDADEFFVSPKRIRSAINKLSQSEVIMIPRIDIDELSGKQLNNDWSLRIFRNINYLRYRGLIHENITNISDDSQLSYVFGSDDLAIYHTGYSLQIIESKLRRNLALIELEIQKYGRKSQHDMALADCYAGLKDYEKSLYHAKQALNSDIEAVTGRGNMYHKILNAMRALKYSDEDMLKVADEAVTNLPNLPEFYAERGMILCGLNRLDEAYISLHKSLEVWRNMPKDIHEESYFSGAVDVVYARLAEIEAFVGNFKEAMNNIKEAIKLNPRNKHYAKLASDYKMRL